MRGVRALGGFQGYYMFRGDSVGAWLCTTYTCQDANHHEVKNVWGGLSSARALKIKHDTFRKGTGRFEDELA